MVRGGKILAILERYALGLAIGWLSKIGVGFNSDKQLMFVITPQVVSSLKEVKI